MNTNKIKKLHRRQNRIFKLNPTMYQLKQLYTHYHNDVEKWYKYEQKTVNHINRQS